jgi:EmrB/QacA subfamily drug resistance transporter
MRQHGQDRMEAAGLDRQIVVLGAVVVLGTIMTVLDLTVVNVAIPTLGRTFAASVASIQWVATAYMLAFASVIPLSGWASERFGAKRVWFVSLLLFLLGSALAGAAWSLESLIAFRVVQGLGAGLILPVGQTILTQAAGPERMGRVMSVIGVPMLLAPVFGPVLGGAIVDAVSWRWIFYINLPVGAAALVAAQRLLPEAQPQLGRRLDVRGLVLLSPGIALFLYGMAEAGNSGGFNGVRALAPTVAGAALVLLFVGHALARGTRALIDLSLFRRRAFAAAAATNFLLPVALFGTLILLPLYYQVVREESPVDVGLLLIPQGVGAALAMPLAGRLTDKLGARVVVTVGLVVALVGTLAYTGVSADTSFAYLAAALFVLGIGISSTIMPSMAAAFQTLAREETPRATSALHAIQRIAGAVGTAAMAIVLQHEIGANLPELDGGIAGLAHLSAQQRAAVTPALADAFATTFWVAVGLIATALVPAVLLPRLRRRQEAGGAATEAAGATPSQGRLPDGERSRMSKVNFDTSASLAGSCPLPGKPVSCGVRAGRAAARRRRLRHDDQAGTVKGAG